MAKYAHKIGNDSTNTSTIQLVKITRPNQTPCPRAESAGEQSSALAGEGLVCAERSFQIRITHGAPADLAARGREHRTRIGDHDHIRRAAEPGDQAIPHRAPERLPFGGILFSRLRDDDDAFCPSDRVGDPERGDAVRSEAGHTGGDRLDLLGADVSATLDDKILLTARDEELAVGLVAEIAGVHPAAVNGRARRLGVAKVPQCHGWAAKLDPALDALAVHATR
jgi:hypothetical protein